MTTAHQRRYPIARLTVKRYAHITASSSSGEMRGKLHRDTVVSVFTLAGEPDEAAYIANAAGVVVGFRCTLSRSTFNVVAHIIVKCSRDPRGQKCLFLRVGRRQETGSRRQGKIYIPVSCFPPPVSYR